MFFNAVNATENEKINLKSEKGFQKRQRRLFIFA
jgi:hypothetical protein